MRLRAPVTLRLAVLLLALGATLALAAPAVVPGESSRHIPRPEDLCPPGTTKHRSFGHDHRRRMWSHCTSERGNGKPVLVGPYVTWNEEPVPGGGARYVLRELTTYRDDERHGPHRVYDGPFQREALVDDETYADGKLEGESRAFYLDGTPRERRSYRGGELDGVRVGYAPDGSERWRVTYVRGERRAAEGDLTVAGQPCPETTVPTFSADGSTAFCARRYLHFLDRNGPYVVWDRDGRIVESGRYENDEKVELWTAPAGVTLPPKVGDDVLVAEIELLVGDEAFTVPLSLDDDSSSASAGDVTAKSNATPADVWFRGNASKEYPHPRHEVRDGVVKVYGLPPGSYYMKVEIDANRKNALQWPGDLFASVDFQVAERQVTRQQGRLLHSLHLLSPRDNDAFIPGWRYPCRDPQAVLAGPIRFAWERPPLDPRVPVEYHYRLTRRECDSHRQLEVVTGKITDTELTLELPRSRPAEIYDWSLVAQTNEQPVGQLMTFGEGGGYGWSLRFRVR